MNTIIRWLNGTTPHDPRYDWLFSDLTLVLPAVLFAIGAICTIVVIIRQNRSIEETGVAIGLTMIRTGGAIILILATVLFGRVVVSARASATEASVQSVTSSAMCRNDCTADMIGE